MGDSRHVKASIQALADELDLLPEVGDEERVISTREAVRLLLPTILKMQRRGYRIERIAERLAASGVKITPGTLRGYLRRGKKPKASSVRKAAGELASPSATTPPPAAAGTNGTSSSPTRPEVRPPAGASSTRT